MYFSLEFLLCHTIKFWSPGCFYAASNLKDAHWSPWWRSVRNQRLPHVEPAASFLLPAQLVTPAPCETRRSNRCFSCFGSSIGQQPSELAVWYSWCSSLGFLPSFIISDVIRLGFWFILHVGLFGLTDPFFATRILPFLSCWLPAILLVTLWRQNFRRLSWEYLVSSGLFSRLSR